MAANQTTNYQLNQWEATDQILRTDFNADNAKVDAALVGLAGAVLHIATGVYVGNGESSRAFSVPFPPKAVFLCTQSGQTYGESGIRVCEEAIRVTGNEAISHPTGCHFLVVSETRRPMATRKVANARIRRAFR